MDSEAYWAQRAEEREQYWHKKCQETIERELASYYRASLGRIQTEIAALYGRFAVDNELTIAEARKLLKGNEFRQWRMDIKEYVKKIEATGDKGLERELNVLAMRSRISRLDKLYSETLMELDKLGRNVSKSMKSFLTDAYKDNYYHGLYDIAKAGELQNAVSKVDSKALEDVLRTRWSGKNYSERIWKNQKLLAKTLKDEMMTAVHRGESVEKISKRVAKRMDVGISNARRLVRTELNFVNNQAAFESIEDAGMKYYRFIATLDRRTSDKCRSMDGEVFFLKDMEYGVNIPPLHPNCRSTIAGSLYGPNKMKTGTRAARDEGGKTVYVPADMTYADWTAVYVDKSKTLEEWLKDHPSETTKGKDDIIKNIIGLRNTYQQQLSAGTEAKDREITIKEAGSEVIKLLDTKELRSITQELNRQVETRKAYYNNWLNAKTKEEKQKWAHEHNTMLKSWKALKADYTFKCADLVKSVLEKFIEIGPGDAPIKEHLYGGRAKMAKYVLDAYSYYPRKWVNESIRAGKIHIKSVKRGYYDGETIALSGDGDYETFRTCVHELGHRMEDVILRILEQEKAFYDRRTDGESLVWLGEITGNPNYRKSEMTRPDKFLNPYMGKDYHGTAYELVSMGVELAYTDTVKLLDDEDMAEWIFGMLAVV